MTYVKSPATLPGRRSVLPLRSIIPPPASFRRVVFGAFRPGPAGGRPPRRCSMPAGGLRNRSGIQCLPAFGPQVVSTAASTMVATAYSTIELMTANTTIVQTPP